MEEFRFRRSLLWVLTLLASGLLLAAAAYAALKEQSFTNSYAALSDAFLHGRLFVEQCFDKDCAVVGGKTFVIFPPVPAVIVLPFIAVFGLGFKGFVAIALVFMALSAALWFAILRRFFTESRLLVWLLLGIVFASPLYYVTIRSNGVWFFAQSVAFLFVSAAFYFSLVKKWLVAAGIALGLAFLSRQMSIFLVPFVFVLALDDNEPLFRISWKKIGAALRLGLPALAAVLAYMAYNYARFGSLFGTGYDHMAIKVADTVMSNRIGEGSIFSLDFGLFNFFYLFFQGFHVQFTGPDQLTLGGLDSFGTSLLAASPFVLYAFFAPNRRETWIGLVTIAVMVVPMLFYHSNGFTQYNTQRYTLDWLPIVFLILGRTLPTGRFEAFPLLVGAGVALNVVAMAVVAVTT